MCDSEELARKERRRRLIERLNEKEKLLGPHTQGRPAQMSEEELAAESEKERQRNLSRQGFPYTGIGGGRASLLHLGGAPMRASDRFLRRLLIGECGIGFRCKAGTAYSAECVEGGFS